MRRARSSELYQVDFVAALFGGFLLVWLSGIGEAEFPGGGGKRPVFFELSARAYYDLEPPVMGERWAPLLPSSAIGLGCAHSSLVGLAKVEGQLFACKTLVSEELTLGDKKSKQYELRVEEAAADRKRPITQPPTLSDGTVLDLLLDDAGTQVVARFVGMVFSKLPDADIANAIGLTDKFFMSEIGVIRDAGLASRPMLIKIEPTGRLGTFLFVIPQRSLKMSSGSEVIDTDSYYFANMPETAAYTGVSALVKRIDVQLRFDKESGLRCRRATVELRGVTPASYLHPLNQSC